MWRQNSPSGWVADEALFRTYEHVDFLAPVHGGDYIEYVGWLEAVGNTSHRVVMEAYKVIESVSEEGLPASAARVLNPRFWSAARRESA